LPQGEIIIHFQASYQRCTSTYLVGKGMKNKNKTGRKRQIVFIHGSLKLSMPIKANMETLERNLPRKL
jgi:hypothetical protein